jgi:hypothetical protein
VPLAERAKGVCRPADALQNLLSTMVAVLGVQQVAGLPTMRFALEDSAILHAPKDSRATPE